MFRKAWKVLLPAVFFLYLYGVNSNLLLNDPDLFWHIKTGEFVLKNWEVPEVDPFAYTTPRPLSESQKTGLRSQWLGQVFFALADRAGGLGGVHFFRNFLIILPSLILYLWMVRKGMGTVTSILVTSLCALFYTVQLFYSFERPQGISFSLLLVLVILLERLKEKSGGGKIDFSFWLIPLLMAVWSNVHAGFIVGNLVVLIYLGSAALSSVYHRARKAGTPAMGPAFFAVCVVALLATVLNPNTYKLFYTYTSGMFSMFATDTRSAFTGETGSWVRDVVLEFKPLHYFYTYLNYKWLMFYWIFTGLLYAAMLLKYWFLKKVDLAELLTVSLVVFFANYHARGLMFSLSIMPFYLAKTLSETRLPGLRFRAMARAVPALMLLLSIGFVTYSIKFSPGMLRPGVTRMLITPWYPSRMVAFIKENRLAPPMYNYYTWGGFLIWSMYPDYQVFIDGRAIDDIVNRTADDILKTQSGWYSKLDAYGINFIAVPLVFRESGHIVPLPPALVNDDKWRLIFLQNNAAVFVRDVPKNREFIFKYNIDKKMIYQEILEIEDIFVPSQPNNPVFSIAKADALFGLGRYAEAKAILERFPVEGQLRLMRLKDMGY